MDINNILAHTLKFKHYLALFKVNESNHHSQYQQI